MVDQIDVRDAELVGNDRNSSTPRSSFRGAPPRPDDGQPPTLLPPLSDEIVLQICDRFERVLILKVYRGPNIRDVYLVTSRNAEFELG